MIFFWALLMLSLFFLDFVMTVGVSFPVGVASCNIRLLSSLLSSSLELPLSSEPALSQPIPILLFNTSSSNEMLRIQFQTEASRTNEVTGLGYWNATTFALHTLPLTAGYT